MKILAPSLFSVFLPAAALSWLAMMVTGITLGALGVFSRGNVQPGDFTEYLAAFAFVMPWPFGFVIAAVFLPVVLIVRAALSRATSAMMLGAACMLSAPVAGLVLLAAGVAWWSASRGAHEYTALLMPLSALAAGGLTFGIAFARLTATHQPSSRVE